MIRKRIIAILTLCGLIALTLVAAPQQGRASSHREAPLISQDPNADNTDLYAFVSPDRPDTVTIVANYIPLEEPAGGPNFNTFADDVLYEINIDNTGDSKEDITYAFRFETKIRNKKTFLYNTGPIDTLDDSDWNMPTTYTVARVQKGNSKVLGKNLFTPPVNIGPRSTPNYEALAAAAVYDLNGTKVFAGQRDDSFFVDLGSIFDLAGLRPFNPAHIIPLPAAPGEDEVSGYNTHAIALQIPISQLTGPDGQSTIGIYASASRQKVSVLRDDGSIDHSGPFVQVSRLGNPLINEVVIPAGKKDLWNRTDPKDDSQFQKFYTSPEVTKLANFLYPAIDNANETNRQDLVAVLLTGVQGLNFTGNTKADLLRLNMSIPPCTADPADDDVGQCRRLGVLAGDLAGFPNGRRLADDVTDIELRALAEGYGSFLNGLLGLPNRTPNNQLGDGANVNDLPFLTAFPYQATPHQGYQHVQHLTGSDSTPALQ